MRPLQSIAFAWWSLWGLQNVKNIVTNVTLYHSTVIAFANQDHFALQPASTVPLPPTNSVMVSYIRCSILLENTIHYNIACNFTRRCNNFSHNNHTLQHSFSSSLLNIIGSFVVTRTKINNYGTLLYSWSLVESNTCSYWLFYGHVAMAKSKCCPGRQQLSNCCPPSTTQRLL